MKELIITLSIFMAFFVAVVTIKCFDTEKQPILKNNKQTDVDNGKYGRIFTIHHDDHVFVIYHYNGASIIHHPQCTNSYCIK
jgi:hypothetical protein